MLHHHVNLNKKYQWVESVNRNLYRINKLARCIGYNKCIGILFFFAFNGCETTAFFQHGKFCLFNLWMENFPEITDVFTELTSIPEFISSDNIAQCDQFTTIYLDQIHKIGIT